MAPRDYLFAVDTEHAALTRLIATATSATGFMKGAPGDSLPGWHRPGADNGDFLASLHTRLAAAYPQAGAPFYAVRLWTNLTWQPAYLAVIAVHLHGAVPQLGAISQARQNLNVDAYRLPPGPQWRGTTEEMIGRAGRELSAIGELIRVEIATLAPLKRLPAKRLLADRMLGLMVRLRQFRPDLTLVDQQRFCTLWLDAMGLAGHGDLELLDLGEGRHVAVSARKGCCLDYLAFPGRYCASCPRQDPALRRARQRADALAELDPTA